MLLTTFPMDRQKCSISLYSFGFYTNEMWLYWNELPNIFYERSVDTLASFKLEHFSQTIKSMEYCSSNITAPCKRKNFLTHEFEFKRFFISVFFISYLPALVMVTLGGLSTFIDPKSTPVVGV